jgi:DNA polymerase-1
MLPARSFDDFESIIAFDFEFGALPGERPSPRCVVARELRTGQEWRVWLDGEARECPYPVGPRVLFIAYYASAEIGCHLALGWPLPENVIDLYVEYRNSGNIFSASARGKRGGLLDALRAYGQHAIDDEEKSSMRELAMRGPPYTEDEANALMAYCATDVDGTARLFRAMSGGISITYALLRGAFMCSAAKMEHVGIPIDVPSLDCMKTHWEEIRLRLIRKVDEDFGVYDDTGRFSMKAFEAYLERAGVIRTWPRTDRGALQTDDDTFRDMAKVQPALQPLRELRAAMGALRLGELAVGSDGRNRTLISAFSARTGRNQPSTTRGIFGASVFMRSLIQPPPGRVLVYVDFCQQEFGIAAALSKDPAMLAAYASGDPYLAFAVQAGAVPPDATKKTHPAERDLYKQCILAVQYSMGPVSLAARTGRPVEGGRQLLNLHRQTYPLFWRWSDAVVDTAMWTGEIQTVFGWRVQAREDARSTSLRNFPMQANGAEMLRLACMLAHDAGVEICMPVHDALLVEGAEDNAEELIAKTITAMEDASELVLGGVRLRAQEEYIVRHPDRYKDPRGEVMWRRVWESIAEVRDGR